MAFSQKPIYYPESKSILIHRWKYLEILMHLPCGGGPEQI
jgi:hypothetical protein